MEAREIVVDLIATGRTQQWIAERAGIKQPAVSKIATGRVADVRSATYRKLQVLHAEVVGDRHGPPTAGSVSPLDAAHSASSLAPALKADHAAA